MSNFKTAESVSPKHPDKLCDQISDAILDAYLAEDPNSRVAVETVGGHGKVFITGEVTSLGDVDAEHAAVRRKCCARDGRGKPGRSDAAADRSPALVARTADPANGNAARAGRPLIRKAVEVKTDLRRT